eukprot:TRINITY_DN5421_c0_g2_i1.p1 TRINITY_DN5421_c0_g2~~TRINITY_DN5421_c0_g2_i1.p1  ORF type:complete len:192 (-),score=34.26 TRINITY_DN5421_c0_g2_i1:186-689(-)
MKKQVVKYVVSAEGAAPWQWCLLWRGSKHGFAAEEFHDRCDGHTNTVTVVRNNHNYVLGGYTPLAWVSRTNWETGCGGRTLVFSLLRKGAPADTFIRCTDHRHCIASNTSYGPCFHGCGSLVLCDECHDKTGSRSDPCGGSCETPPEHPFNEFFAGSSWWKTSKCGE